jgi:tRNA-modifying protein YgfZ
MAPFLDMPAIYRRDAGVVSVSGPDRLTYLHTMLSQHLADAAAGTAADFLYLDAKGNVLAEGRALVRSGDVLLVVANAAVAADLTAALEKFKFLTEVEAVDLSAGWAVACVRGPEVPDVPGARSEPMRLAPHGPGVVVRDRSGGVDLVGPAGWVDERVADLRAGQGLPEAGPADWQAWRIAAGAPAWAAEIVPGRRPQELGLLPTHVHLRKGCYPGQESIAKVFNLGRPRRALAVVQFDAGVVPGEAVEAGGKPGEVTSAAPAGDGWVALALLPVARDTGEVLGDGSVRAAGGATGRVDRRVGEGLPLAR